MSSQATIIDLNGVTPASPNGEPLGQWQGDNQSPRKTSVYVPWATYTGGGAIRLAGDLGNTGLLPMVCGILGIQIDFGTAATEDGQVLVYTPSGTSYDGASIGKLVFSHLFGDEELRTTTSEIITQSSRGKILIFTNASAIAVSIDITNTNGHFLCALMNNGAGAATFTPSSGQIDSGSGLAATASLASGEKGWLFRTSSGNCRLMKISTGGAGGFTNAGIQAIFGDGTNTIATGNYDGFFAEWDGTITGWTMAAEDGAGAAVVGNAQVTIKKSAGYAGYPTTTSIVASAPPQLVAQSKAQSSTLTGWTVNFSKGDFIRWNLDSCDSTIKRLVVNLSVTRTS